MNNFQYMEDSVKEICRSLTEEPMEWLFETHTFKKKGTSVSYWLGNPRKVWTGHTTEIVFSDAQGERILEAVYIARQSQASEYQNKVRDSLKVKHTETKETSGKHWWEFWK